MGTWEFCVDGNVEFCVDGYVEFWARGSWYFAKLCSFFWGFLGVLGGFLGGSGVRLGDGTDMKKANRALRPNQHVWIAYPDSIERAIVLERGTGDYNIRGRNDPYLVATQEGQFVSSRAFLHEDKLAAAVHSEQLYREHVADGGSTRDPLISAKAKKTTYTFTLPDGQIVTRKSFRPYTHAWFAFDTRENSWYVGGFSSSRELADRAARAWATKNANQVAKGWPAFGERVQVIPVEIK